MHCLIWSDLVRCYCTSFDLVCLVPLWYFIVSLCVVISVHLRQLKKVMWLLAFTWMCKANIYLLLSFMSHTLFCTLSLSSSFVSNISSFVPSDVSQTRSRVHIFQRLSESRDKGHSGAIAIHHNQSRHQSDESGLWTDESASSHEAGCCLSSNCLGTWTILICLSE